MRKGIRIKCQPSAADLNFLDSLSCPVLSGPICLFLGYLSCSEGTQGTTMAVKNTLTTITNIMTNGIASESGTAASSSLLQKRHNNNLNVNLSYLFQNES